MQAAASTPELGKRRREEEKQEDRTPKRAAPSTPSTAALPNPFLSPGRLLSPPHPSISPALTSLQEISEKLYRQDRLLHAADAAKEVFRKKIKEQQQRIQELEQRVKELEK